jgi:hypothetical protein
VIDRSGDIDRPPPDSEFGVPRESLVMSIRSRMRAYFLGSDPTFWVAMVPALALSALLFTRSLTTNFIFDEQEALLANPYVNGKSLRFIDVIHRDFWGLPPERSVGSYRPLPNILWRSIAVGLRGLHDTAARLTHSSSTFALYPRVCPAHRTCFDPWSVMRAAGYQLGEVRGQKSEVCPARAVCSLLHLLETSIGGGAACADAQSVRMLLTSDF